MHALMAIVSKQRLAYEAGTIWAKSCETIVADSSLHQSSNFENMNEA